jgi:hypothetical protein
VTTFAQLVADVYTTTNRPDLVAETNLAVRKATMKLHTTGWDMETDRPKGVLYWPDRTEKVVPVTAVDPTLYTYSVPIAAPILRFRGLSYLRQYTPDVTDRFFNSVDFDRLFDEYQVEKTDVYYMLGQMINIRSSVALIDVLVGFYQYPVVTQVGYSSWVADQLPDMIVEEACSLIFKMIGKDDEYQKYNALFKENAGMLEGQFTTQSVRT